MASKFGGIPVNGAVSKFGGVPVDFSQAQAAPAAPKGGSRARISRRQKDVSRSQARLAALSPEQRELAESTGALETAAIAFGSGTARVLRGIGLGDAFGLPSAESSKKALAPLREVSGGGFGVAEAVGEAAPFIPLALAAPVAVPALATGGGAIAAGTVLGAAEGAIIARGEGQSITSQLKDAGSAGGLTLAASLLFPKAGRLIKKIRSKGSVGRVVGNVEIAELMAREMQKEGLTPATAAAELAKMGEQGLPADVGANFLRLLDDAKNVIPRISGRVNVELPARVAGAGPRIADDVSDALGLTVGVDEALKDLDRVLGPRVDALYATARASDFKPSGDLLSLIDTNPKIQSAVKRASENLDTRRSVGDAVGEIDFIDELKRALDDKISVAVRAGEGGEVRLLVRSKKALLKEADLAVPEYKEARNLFAGQAELSNAADMGKKFFKLNQREIGELVDVMGESERAMFTIGAREAILDRIDATATNRNIKQAIFGRSGDTAKLEALFPNKKDFNDFQRGLEREAAFVRTKRIAGQSTTTQQLLGAKDKGVGIGDVAAVSASVLSGIPILKRFLKDTATEKSEEARLALLGEAADFLLEKGVDPSRLQRILETGEISLMRGEIAKELKRQERALSGRVAPALGVTIPVIPESGEQE